MNKSRLDMNTASASTATMAATGLPPSPRSLPSVRLPATDAGGVIRGDALTVPSFKVSLLSGLTVTRAAAVRPVFGLSWYAAVHGVAVRSAQTLLDSAHARACRGEVGAACRARGLPRQPQV